jgi:hypothetical protein
MDSGVAVLDTSVLYSSLTRSLLLYAVEQELYRPVWSDLNYWLCENCSENEEIIFGKTADGPFVLRFDVKATISKIEFDPTSNLDDR